MVRLFLVGIVCLLGFASCAEPAGTIWSNGSDSDRRWRADDDDRKKLWKEVEDAMAKSLPATAIEKLDAIIQSAIQDEDFDEAVHAV
jgi:hypothetical protein